MSLAAYKNSEPCFSVLYQYAKSFITLDKHPLKIWADSQNAEGFVALHFAAFHGNVEIIKMLVEDAKADLNLVNSTGCSVLHLAAQGN